MSNFDPQHATGAWGQQPPPRKRGSRTSIAVAWMIFVVTLFVCVTLLSNLDAQDATNADPAATGSTQVDPLAQNATSGSTKPKMTTAQRQAVRSAESYITYAGFSKAGLMRQLTSESGEGFTQADARYAVNHIKVNWNTEAVQSARSYLDMTGFSRSGLIRQLHSSAGDGYTLKQATYAANKVGL